MEAQINTQSTDCWTVSMSTAFPMTNQLHVSLGLIKFPQHRRTCSYPGTLPKQELQAQLS